MYVEYTHQQWKLLDPMCSSSGCGRVDDRMSPHTKDSDPGPCPVWSKWLTCGVNKPSSFLVLSPVIQTYDIEYLAYLLALPWTTCAIQKHSISSQRIHHKPLFNHLTPNGHYMGRTAQLTSRCCILCIYSTNIRTEYFKHAAYSPSFPFKNALYFIMLPFWGPVLFTF